MEDALSQMRRHVKQAEQYVSDQKRMIEKMVRDKHPAQADLARRVLQNLEASLLLAREHVWREQEKRASAKKRADHPDRL